MGLKRVTADQILEAEMQANKTVLISDKNSQNTEENSQSVQNHGNEDPYAFPVFTLQRASDSTESASVTEIIPKPKHDVNEPETSLRKRNLKDFHKLTLKDDPSDESQILDDDEEVVVEEKNNETCSTKTDKEQIENRDDSAKSEKQRTKKLFNPLNFFGILVPRELRTSQHQFEKAVGLAVQISNLKQQLQSLQFQYRRLRGVEAQDI